MTASTGAVVSTVAAINQRENDDVWEVVTTFPLISGDTTGAATVVVNGLLQKVIVKLPNTTADTQLSITLKDNGDNTIFSAGPLAETASYAYSVSEPLSGETDIALSFTNPQSSADAVVTLRGV